MKIYTKRGDSGETSLFGGQRVSKSHSRIDAYGTVDELNSILGLVNNAEPIPSISEIITEIQKTLFVLGADLATPNSKTSKIERIAESHINQIEYWIDDSDQKLPQLTSFILPSGSTASCHLHHARTVCRRAERLCISAKEIDDSINPNSIIFLNRLSDLFFMLARLDNHEKQIEETRWLP